MISPINVKDIEHAITLNQIIGLKIVDTSVKTDPDTGRSRAIVEFSDGSTMTGYTDRPAIRRLLERAQANA